MLETALAAAGVDFELEIGAGGPDWSRLIDLLARTTSPVWGGEVHLTGVYLGVCNS